jgi:hypothetical protein
MIESTNYKQLSKSTLSRLQLLLHSLYPDALKRIRVKKNGTVVLIKSLFKRNIRIHISDLIFGQIPRALSLDRYNSLDFVDYINEKVLENMNKYEVSEINKVTAVINELTYWLNKKGEEAEIVEESYTPALGGKTIVIEPREEKQEGLILFKDHLFHIFQGIMRKKQFAYSLILTLGLRLSIPLMEQASRLNLEPIEGIAPQIRNIVFNTS